MDRPTIPISPGDAAALEAAIRVFEQMDHELPESEVAELLTVLRSILPKFQFGLRLTGREVKAFAALIDFAHGIVKGTTIVPAKLRKQLLPHRAVYERLFPFAFQLILLSGEAEPPL